MVYFKMKLFELVVWKKVISSEKKVKKTALVQFIDIYLLSKILKNVQ